MQKHPVGTHPRDVNPDRNFCSDSEGRERDVSNENITHWLEPWRSKSLSEMFPHGRETVGVRGEEGTERNGVGLLASLISLIKRRKKREEDTREGAPEK